MGGFLGEKACFGGVKGGMNQLRRVFFIRKTFHFQRSGHPYIPYLLEIVYPQTLQIRVPSIFIE